MNKDFNEKKLLSMSLEKQFKVLYDLASFIEENNYQVDSNHFEKLTKYHDFLKIMDSDPHIKLFKEFNKIKAIDYQFQIYLMTLERFLGQSKKEYQFLINKGDGPQDSKRVVFPIICIMDSIRSAHNIGSMLRNAECFGVQKVILTGLSPTTENAQVKKTAMGCDQMIPTEYYKSATNIVKELKSQGHIIWSIETTKTAKQISSINNIPSKLVLIFGHEQHGVSHELLELSDEVVEIPLFGLKNSLNVSMSQGIVLAYISQLLSQDK
jgi:23S rRNA (guanosine2251-2'-O)-methyltransferase